MYLGIDFLIDPELKLYVSEVNVGLPGGAQEYERVHLVRQGRPSGIFAKIEETSLRVHGKSFRDYLASLPFLESLKSLKIWMDGQGSFPASFHPALRLEDKWVQAQILNSHVPLPETMIFDPRDPAAADSFLTRRQKSVIKRRLGRGGRNFRIMEGPLLRDPVALGAVGQNFLLQEYIESKVGRYTFSIRALAFAGEFMCMYANLSTRAHSNHGILAYISPGDRLKLEEADFQTESFNQRSWEAGLWFGPPENEPGYLRHNLYEDEAARTALILPAVLYQALTVMAVKIERLYEGFDFSALPPACFE